MYLRGARQIAKKLQDLGIIDEHDPDPAQRVYHLERTGKLQLDRFGRELITTPDKLEKTIAKQIL